MDKQTQPEQSVSRCPTCGAPLVERDRWTITMDDWEAKVRAEVGRPPTATERARLARTLGDWRELWCPVHPEAVGFLAERL